METQVNDGFQQHDHIVKLIYSTLDGRSSWRDVLDEICIRFGASGAALVGHNFVSRKSAIRASSTLFSQKLKGNSHYCLLHRNPWFDFEAQYQPGEVLFGRDLLQPAALERLDIYKSCLKPLGIHYRLCGVIKREGMQIEVITLVRPTTMPPFEREIQQQLAPITAHIRHALELHRAVQTQRLGYEALHNALDQIPVACLLVDQDSQLRFSNAAADQLLAHGHGLRLANGRVATGNTRDSNQLRKAVFELATQISGDASMEPVDLTVPGNESYRPMFMRMIAANNRQRSELHDSRGLVAIFAKTPDHGSLQGIDNFAQAYSLTPAETRILGHMAKGKGLFEAAQDLGISNNTARTHSKHIYGKLSTHDALDNGVHNQTGLIKLLGQYGII